MTNADSQHRIYRIYIRGCESGIFISFSTHSTAIISSITIMNTMVSLLVLSAILLTSSYGSEIRDLFERGFGLQPSHSTPHPPTPSSRRVPQHISDLMLQSGSRTSNRVVSKNPSSMAVSQHSMTVRYNNDALDDTNKHGVLQEVELVVYTRHIPADTTLILSIQGVEHQYNVSADQSRGTITLSIAPEFTSQLEITISAHQHVTSAHGVHVTSTLAISRLLSLKHHPQLVLHYLNSAILHPAAGTARRHILKMYGETATNSHHLSRRSSDHTSHCQARDLIVNFADIGLGSVIAPAEFNARLCSGDCHVDHADTPMTNHAYIQNLVSYSGGESEGAMCVSDTTTPLTVLVSDGDEFHMTVYEDMIVESCSCR